MFNLLRPLISHSGRSSWTRSTLPLICVRNNNACKAKKPLPAAHAKFRKLQKHFQQDDGKPIFLKNAMDIHLYRLTMALALVGLLLDVKLFLGYILA